MTSTATHRDCVGAVQRGGGRSPADGAVSARCETDTTSPPAPLPRCLSLVCGPSVPSIPSHSSPRSPPPSPLITLRSQRDPGVSPLRWPLSQVFPPAPTARPSSGHPLKAVRPVPCPALAGALLLSWAGGRATSGWSGYRGSPAARSVTTDSRSPAHHLTDAAVACAHSLTNSTYLAGDLCPSYLGRYASNRLLRWRNDLTQILCCSGHVIVYLPLLDGICFGYAYITGHTKMKYLTQA